jgi:hypothetical protein
VGANVIGGSKNINVRPKKIAELLLKAVFNNDSLKEPLLNDSVIF